MRIDKTEYDGDIKLFRFISLGPYSVYLDWISSSLDLKLLLYTEAFKVKKFKCVQTQQMQECESILAYIETFQIKNFSKFVMQIRNIESV